MYFDSNTSLHIGGSASEFINGELIVKDLIRSGKGSIIVDATNNIVADLAITITDDTGSNTDDGGDDEEDTEQVTPDQVAAGQAVPGETITYTITVTNNGPLGVTGATVHDAFPAAITSDTFTAVGSSGASGFTTNGSGTINDTVNMAVGSTITYTVVAQIASSASGQLSDTATVTPPASPSDPNLTNNTATDTVTLTPEADLAITKVDNVGGSSITDSTGTAVPGTNVTYTIVVTNNGPSNVVGAVISDVFPAGITSDSFTAVGTGGATGFTESGTGTIVDTVTMPMGSTITYTVTAAIDPAATGSLTNTASVADPDSTADTDGSNNTASDTDTLTPQVDLAVTKSDGQTSAVPGTTDAYTITVTNNGPSTVSSVTLTDTVPAALDNPVFAAATGNYDSGTGVWSGLSLASGQSITMTVSGTIDPGATDDLTNTVSVNPPAGATETNPSDNTSSDTDTLTPQADLSITKKDNAGGSSVTDSTGSVVPGTNLVYMITVTNNGPSDVVGATVSDLLPAGITSDTFTAVPTGGATGFTSSGTGNINDTVTLPAGATITYTVTAAIDPTATGSLSNTASVAVPDGTTDTDTTNNSATDTDTLTPQADLAVTKTDGQTTAAPGADDTYTVTVTNNGPSTVTSLNLTDTLPTALGSVTFTPSTGSYDTGTGTWSGLNLASGQSITMQVKGTIDPTASDDLVNSVSVATSAGVTDTNTANNMASDTDTLTPQADLSVTKDDGTDSVFRGTTDTYTITVTNNGPSTVTSVTLNDTVPTGFDNPVFTPATGSYDSGTGVWSGLNLASGQSATMTLSGTIDAEAPETITNTVTVSPPGGVTDANTANNTATDTDDVTSQIE